MNLSVYRWPDRIRPPKPGPISRFYHWKKRLWREDREYAREIFMVNWNAKRHFGRKNA